MFRATLKGLLSRKLRLTLSGLAVVLGVMFVAGSFVLTESLGKSFESLFASAFEDTDVSVSGKEKVDSEDTLTPPPPVPASLVDTIRDDVPGVADAYGSIYAENAKLVGKNGKVISSFGPPSAGTNWTGKGTITQLRDGKAPETDGQVAINGTLAKTSGFKVGDRVEVVSPFPAGAGQKKSFELVGIFGYSGDRDSLGGELTMAFTTPIAQKILLGEENVYSEVVVTAADGVSQNELAKRVRAQVGDQYQVQTGEELAKKQSDSIKEGLAFFNYVLLGFAGVALFVGIFLILNTFSIIVASRIRELALMRAIGASRGQMIGSVFLEAMVIGVLATLLGMLAGIGIGYLLSWVFGNLGGANLELKLGIPVAGMVISFVLGVLITAIAAILPALRASRVPPVAAMRDAATQDKPLTRITLIGAVVFAAGATLLGLGLAGFGSGTTILWEILAGVLVCFIGVALLTPIVGRPVVSVIGRIFSWSLPGKLGRRNSARNPRRTAITAAALMVGVALIVGVSVVLASLTKSFQTTVDKQLKADLIISGQQTGPIPPSFDANVLTESREIPTVQSVAGIWVDFAQIDDKAEYVAAVDDLQAYAGINGLSAKSGSFGSLGPDQVVLNEQTAKDRNLKVGDPVTMQFARGQPKTFTVSAVMNKSDLANVAWTVSADNASSFATPNPVYGYIQVENGANVKGVQNRVDELLADSPEVTVTDRSSFVDQQLGFLNTVKTMIQILLTLAIIIAALGVINTLALSVIERTRELGLLRAVGLRRSQSTRMIMVEAVVISLFGALLGIVVGTGLGAAVVRALKDQGLTEFAFPWGTAVTYLVLAVVIGVLAAILPAIRAARLNVLNAIAYE